MFESEYDTILFTVGCSYNIRDGLALILTFTPVLILTLTFKFFYLGGFIDMQIFNLEVLCDTVRKSSCSFCPHTRDPRHWTMQQMFLYSQCHSVTDAIL